MKFFIYMTFIILFSNSFVFSQTNSVLLKDEGGTIIGSYASVLEAYTAISEPLSQAYGIELQNTYTAENETFPLTLGNKSGVSPTNTITVYPASDVTSMTIEFSAYNSAVIILSGANYVTIDGRPGATGTTGVFTISQTSISGGNSSTIEITDGSNYNTLQYLNIKALNLVLLSGTCNVNILSSETSAGNVGNAIKKCNIEGSSIGIRPKGGTTNHNDSTLIKDNIIYDFGYAGIQIHSNSDNTLIEGNFIYKTNGSGSNLVTGILSGYTSGGTTIVRKNIIYNLQSASPNDATIRGISFYSVDMASLQIYNNFVSLTVDNNLVTQYNGIFISFVISDDWNVEVLYNTILIGGIQSGGTNPVTSGITRDGTGTGGTYIQKNNIVLNTRSGGTATYTGFYITNLNGNLDIDYNSYYTTDPSGFHAYWGSTGYNDLLTYKAAVAPYEQHSTFTQPEFVSPIDLHLAGTSIGNQDFVGMPIPTITEDIDGDIRNPDYPYMGADESDVPLPVELLTINAEVMDNNVNLYWITTTESNNKGFEIQKKVSNNEFKNIGYTPGYGTTTEIKSYSFTDYKVPTGKHIYRLKQIDFDGSYEYSREVEVDVTSPMEFSLDQNYPNPFNPTTTIKYAVPKTVNVDLKVFDILGREVKTLVNETKSAGYYEVQFNANSLAGGVYFYRLKAGEYIKTGKMLLLK
jgi:hypothetical protein